MMKVLFAFLSFLWYACSLNAQTPQEYCSNILTNSQSWEVIFTYKWEQNQVPFPFIDFAGIDDSLNSKYYLYTIFRTWENQESSTIVKSSILLKYDCQKNTVTKLASISRPNSQSYTQINVVTPRYVVMRNYNLSNIGEWSASGIYVYDKVLKKLVLSISNNSLLPINANMAGFTKGKSGNWIVYFSDMWLSSSEWAWFVIDSKTQKIVQL